MGLVTFAQRQMRRALGMESGYASAYSDNSQLSDITMEDWLGALPDHVAVTRGNAMTLATIAAGRNVIAGTVGRLPLYALQGGKRVPQPQQPALLGQLERGVPRATTLAWTVDALIFQPRTWWRIVHRDYYGWPDWVEFVPKSKAGLDADGRLVRVGMEDVAPEDVICFDSPLGEGLLKNARKNIQRAIAIDLAAAKAEDSPIPAVELHDELGVDLSPEKRKDLLDNWAAARRTRGVAYTPKGIKVIPHGKPADALLIDGRRAISLDLIRQLNLPAWAASTAIEGATMTYDNRALRNWELIDLTLAPYLTAIAGRLSMPDVTPRGWEIEFDTDDLTRDDMKTRFESYRIGLGADTAFIDQAFIDAQEGWATSTERNPA